MSRLALLGYGRMGKLVEQLAPEHGFEVAVRLDGSSNRDGAGITEDPVTGSAHCNVVPYWHSKTGMDKMRCRQLSARGGELLCQLKDDRVLMSGKAVLFMKGEIYL